MTTGAFVVTFWLLGAIHVALEASDEIIHYRSTLTRREHAAHLVLAALACAALLASLDWLLPRAALLWLVGASFAIFAAEEIAGIHGARADRRERRLHALLCVSGSCLVGLILLSGVTGEARAAMTAPLRLLLAAAVFRFAWVGANAAKAFAVPARA
jgi:hypothetical protein